MRFSYSAVAAVLACLPASLAQTSTDCNPTNKTCPADTGLSSSTYSADFTAAGSNASWTAAAYSEITYGDDGAVFTISKEGQAPTIETDFYIFFGKVEVSMKAASGQGIVSSIVLESDDLDEIDWEFLGGDTTQVQSNFYGKGNTTSYDRAIYHTVAAPQDSYHTYTFDWNKDRIEFLIDGSTVRTVEYSQASTVYGKNYPQTPMRLKLGNWAGGASGNSEGTIEWAGGEVDFNDGPFTMYVKSVSISNSNPACSYEYKDMTGSFSSIDIVTTGDSCSSNATTSGSSTSGSYTFASTTSQAPKSSHSVVPVHQTEAVVSTTITGSAYSTNSASASALNDNIGSATSLATSGSATASGPASTSTGESYAGSASSIGVAAAGVMLSVMTSLWVL